MSSARESPANDNPAPPGARADLRRFIGVSLGGGRGKSTAIARLEFRVEPGRGPLEPSPGPFDEAALTRRSQARAHTPPGELVLAEARARVGQRGGGEVGDVREAPFRDDVLLAWLGRWVDPQTVVAWDVPLTLPPCVRCRLPCPGLGACTVPVVQWMLRNAGRLAVGRGRTDPGKPAVTPYTQRATELLLARATLQPREALGQGMGPLAARAVYLRRALSPKLRLNENLLEVHPRATLIRMFGAEQERRTRHGSDLQVWDKRKQMLGQLVEGLAFDRVWPDLVVRNIHVFHAVVAAFSAYFWAREAWRGPDDLLDIEDPQLGEAVDELGDLWLEDGWIWTPPARLGSSKLG